MNKKRKRIRKWRRVRTSPTSTRKNITKKCTTTLTMTRKLPRQNGKMMQLMTIKMTTALNSKKAKTRNPNIPGNFKGDAKTNSKKHTHLHDCQAVF